MERNHPQLSRTQLRRDIVEITQEPLNLIYKNIHAKLSDKYEFQIISMASDIQTLLKDLRREKVARKLKWQMR